MATEQELAAYKKTLVSICQKSEETFEKQLSYISAGSIGVSMLIIEHMFSDFAKTINKPFLMIGWISLASTLLINLLSHVLASRLNYKTISDIDGKKYNSKKASFRRDIIAYMNYATIVLMAIGIISIIFYVYKNL
jgi:hypothetical protein